MYKYVTAKNIKLNGIDLDDITYVTADIHKEIFSRCNPEFGDILYIKDGATSGIATVNTLHEEFSLLSSIALLKPANDIDRWYMCYAMQSPYFYNTTRYDMHGVGITRITLNMLTSRLIPVPPQTEQQQISSKCKALINLVYVIENEREGIFRIISNAKSRILDLAIHGKLVPQDPNDEPASVLLERIRAEKEELVKQGKIKHDKMESAVFKGEDNSYYEKIGKEIHCIDEEILFKIPDGWQWCRLGTLFSHNTGKALNSSATEGSMLTYITTSNVYWDHFELDNLKQMLFKDDEIEKCTVKKGDLLVCEGGDIGRAAIWDSSEPIRIQNHIHRLRAYGGIYTPFYYYIFYFYKKSGYIKGNGIGLQGLSSNQIHKIIVPLPPFNMQKQIVKRINSLFKCLNKIETDINM